MNHAECKITICVRSKHSGGLSCKSHRKNSGPRFTRTYFGQKAKGQEILIASGLADEAWDRDAHLICKNQGS